MFADHFIRSVLVEHDVFQKADPYLRRIPSLSFLEELELHPKVTFFVGENGSGKSTLLEAIAIAAGLNPEGGSRNFNFGTAQSHSSLSASLRLVRGVRRPKTDFFLRAESFFNVATEVDKLQKIDGGMYAAYGGDSLHHKSHGESFWSLLENRFGPNGLYFLDEPEAALSPSRQLATLCRIHELVQRRSQFIIATHSPILMAYPDATIYLFSERGIQPINYKDTEHYHVTRDFLNHVDASLSELLRD
jgi:predicted ATPase